MKLEDLSEKVTEARFFGKILVCPNLGKKGPKMLFLLFLKIRSLIFSDIVHES